MIVSYFSTPKTSNLYSKISPLLIKDQSGKESSLIEASIDKTVQSDPKEHFGPRFIASQIMKRTN